MGLSFCAAFCMSQKQSSWRRSRTCWVLSQCHVLVWTRAGQLITLQQDTQRVAKGSSPGPFTRTIAGSRWCGTIGISPGLRASSGLLHFRFSFLYFSCIRHCDCNKHYFHSALVVWAWSTLPWVPVAAEFTQPFCKLDCSHLRLGTWRMRDIQLLDMGSLEWVSFYLRGTLWQGKRSSNQYL